ncbi:hypothetical protein [Flavobacterium phage FL-1]|nr:hypothetical protein [Flavobacterium phage FL-1]
MEKIKCIYPNGLQITKHDIIVLKDFKVIVLNSLKIDRLTKQLKS